MNEEFPVSASHQLALITSLPFVHTARRYYRLDGLVRPLDWTAHGGLVLLGCGREEVRTRLSRGSKSRNKVTVGEPSVGSLSLLARVLIWSTYSSLLPSLIQYPSAVSGIFRVWLPVRIHSLQQTFLAYGLLAGMWPRDEAQSAIKSPPVMIAPKTPGLLSVAHLEKNGTDTLLM